MGLDVEKFFERLRSPRSLMRAVAALALVATACGGGTPAAPAAKPAEPAKPAAAADKPAAAADKPAAQPAQQGSPSKPAESAAPAASGAGGTVSCAEHASKGNGGAKIVIGADASLTGATASFGQGMKKGIEVCLKEFNEAGGYQGRLVEIPILDDEVKPEKAVNNITRFIQQDKVVGIIGPVNSGNALAFLPKAEEAEIPVIIPIATAVQLVYNVDKDLKITGAKKYVFRTSMQDDYQVEKIMAYAKAKGWDALGLMHDTSGYGTATGAVAEKIISSQGIKIPQKQTYNIGDTDMTSQLTKMKDAGVKQIINFGLGPENSNLLKSAEKIGYKPQWSGAWGWSDPVVPQLAGKDLSNGVITLASFTIDQSPAAANFHEKVMKGYNENPFPITAAQAYDATKMMLMALSKAGPDSKKVRDAIESLDGFKGVTAAPSKPYSATKHHSLEADNIFVATWKDGSLIKAQ
ncbi:MAG: ABC transporter substrate-binding protein [Chloroflexi bacterium]|nr:ABC transporter substrate-binding protein [Chloroflexota bacterium]